MRSAKPLVLVFGLCGSIACESQSRPPLVPEPDLVTDAPTEPTTLPRPPANAPQSSELPIATGERSARASAVLTECTMSEPPANCSTDGDCATFDVLSGSCGGCASTFTFG